MKTIAFLFAIGLGLFQIANSQTIELIGKGVLNDNIATITFTDHSSIDSVVVEAAAVFRNDLTPKQVNFTDANDNYIVDFNLAELDFAPGITNGNDQKWGYYTAIFYDVDAGGITLDKMGQGENILSFTAYIYRKESSSDTYSEVEYDHAFFFHNGAADPLTYNFTLPWSSEPRDIEVVVPISELTEDGRYASLRLTAGAFTFPLEFDSNNQGELLNLQTIVLNNVPGDITDVSLYIYSPKLIPDGKVGDSFVTGAILLTTTFNSGCTHTQGYWKTHSEYGPASKSDDTWIMIGGPNADFFISGMSYLETLNASPKGNAYFILAHQYIAAKLNFCSGADNSAVVNVFNEATSLLNNYTPSDVKRLKGNHPVRKMFIFLGEILDEYNNGLIGPGHCDENEEGWEKSARISDEDDVLNKSDVVVYPNPVRNSVTVIFKPLFDGKATVDFYNSCGQKVSRLLDQNVKEDIPVNFTFDGSSFPEGLYILSIQNGSSIETTKVEISK